MIWLLFSLCYASSTSSVDVKNAECATGCRRSGYTAGRYLDKGCECSDYKDYNSITGRQLSINVRKKWSNVEPGSPPPVDMSRRRVLLPFYPITPPDEF